MVVSKSNLLYFQYKLYTFYNLSYNYEQRDYEFVPKSFTAPGESSSRPTQPNQSNKRKKTKNHKKNTKKNKPN